MTTPAQEYDDLVKRLVDVGVIYHGIKGGWQIEQAEAIMEEAAAAITALRKERDAALEALKIIKTHWERMGRRLNI